MGRNRSPVDKYGLDLTFVNIQMVRIPNKGIGKGESGKKSLLCFVYAERELASSSNTEFANVCMLITGWHSLHSTTDI